MIKIIFILILGRFFLNVHSSGSLLCTNDFCKSHVAKEPCHSLPQACNIQNATYNGVFLPAAGPCNCCPYCVENLYEGDQCALGNPSSPTPTFMCGHSLACTLKNNVTTCQTMDTPCTRAQLHYDEKRKNGTLGHLEIRPVCDRNGIYEPYFCIPEEICYCVSKDGKRIFGEMPFTTNSKYSLRCKCSRNIDEAFKINNRDLRPDEYLRCDMNGDYDTLQCIGDECLCVDAEDGHPTYSHMALINVTLISAKTLPCFDNKTHTEGEYYRICERSYREQLNRIKGYEIDGVEQFGYTLPNCQFDGYYAPVQQTSKTKYCSDKYGKQLENYEILVSDPLSVNMNCKCARARHLITLDEKPECCKNGNYKKLQCRRGLCRCVNENGVQIEKEVDFLNRHKLSCFKNICS